MNHTPARVTLLNTAGDIVGAFDLNVSRGTKWEAPLQLGTVEVAAIDVDRFPPVAQKVGKLDRILEILEAQAAPQPPPEEFVYWLTTDTERVPQPPEELVYRRLTTDTEREVANKTSGISPAYWDEKFR